MKETIRLLVVLIALPLAASAQLAETYLFKAEAGRSSGIVSNVAIDIIAHGVDSAGVWMATGRGVNYSLDQGANWFGYNMTHGLPAENLSAIFSIAPSYSGGGRLWVASNHNELIQDQLMTLSDGLTFTDDGGETWTTLDFGGDGLDIPYVIGGDRTIYDITGHTDREYFNHRPDDNHADWLFAAAFAGGLLASQDGGVNWRRIFPSRSDSIQYAVTSEAPSLRNRYFSCVADTSHGDSLFLWAGTASGIFQYVFAPPRDKLYSRRINRIAFCDTCSAGDGSRYFAAGQAGLSLGSAAGGNLSTRFEVDGLPGPEISAVFSIGDKLIVGTADAAGVSTGLALSSDGGETFVELALLPWVPAAGRANVDFAEINGRVYTAVENAGVYVSVDSGQFWDPVPIDTWLAQPELSVAHALDADGDTLFVGTDAGLVKLTFDALGDITAADTVAFGDTDSTGAQIVRIRHQVWTDNFFEQYFDHNILWTVHRSLTDDGIPMVGRFGPAVDTTIDTTYDTITPDPLEIDTIYTMYKDTSGFSWRYFRRGVEVRDMNFFSDTVFAVGDNSIWFTPRIQDMTNFFSARQYSNDTLVVANLDTDTVTSMEVRADTVIFGTFNGLAISQDRGATFRIHRANTDTLAADLVINHSYLGTLGGLAGDFVPALGVQYRAGATARIWAGARPGEYGGQGISAADFDPADGSLHWQTVYEDDFAWNFAFLGDTILAASNVGLLLNDGVLDSLETVWGIVPLTDEASGEILVSSGTAVYGVEAIDPYVWVGTDDGTVRISRSDLTSQTLFNRVDVGTPDDEVYAFPVPFRPGAGGTVDFRFVVEQAGTVTVEVYDFAMNLVATPIDNVYYAAGHYPEQGSQGITWDGYNDQGDLVAVGVYYFKVEYQSGETRWGKLAVIP